MPEAQEEINRSSTVAKAVAIRRITNTVKAEHPEEKYTKIIVLVLAKAIQGGG